MGVFEEAPCNVGKDNALWILVLAICSPIQIIIAALIAGKSGAEITPYLKWTAICTITAPILGIGWILSLIIACKTKSLSES